MFANCSVSILQAVIRSYVHIGWTIYRQSRNSCKTGYDCYITSLQSLSRQSINTHMHTHTHTRTHTYKHTHTHTYKHKHTRTHTHIHTYTHIHTRTHIRTHKYFSRLYDTFTLATGYMSWTPQLETGFLEHYPAL